MKKAYLKKVPAVLFAAAVTSTIVGCATNEVISKAKQPRYVGYSNLISINGQKMFGGGSMMEYEQFQRQVEIEGKFQAGNSVEAVVGEGSTIFTTEMVGGDFTSNYGKKVDLIFSIQPCTSVTFRNNAIARCAESNPVRPISIRRSIVLKGGESVHLTFPNGAEWNYRVFDQSSLLTPDDQ